MTDLKFYTGQKVLITGNTGFKGTWLTSMLLHLGAEVIGVASFGGQLNPTFAATGLESRIKQYKVDIRDATLIEQVIETERPRFIFHLAAQALTLRGIREPGLTFHTNVQGTVNVLESLKKTNHKCAVIVVTSDKCYENKEWYWSYRESDRLFGADPYGASKSMAENVVRAYHHTFFKKTDSVKVATVRAGNVFGGGDWSANRLVPDCIRAWSEGRQIDIRSAKATRPWSYVLDILRGYLMLGKALSEREELNGESFNFGPTKLEPIPVLDFVERIWSSFGTKGTTVPINVVSSNSEKVENTQLRLSSEKAMIMLDWHPVLDINMAIDETVYWYKQYLEDTNHARLITDCLVSEYLSKNIDERGLCS